VILSTISWYGWRKPFRSFGSTARRKSGASQAALADCEQLALRVALRSRRRRLIRATVKKRRVEIPATASSGNVFTRAALSAE
jgi:hypothetical protein